jgi:hypothetical protein
MAYGVVKLEIKQKNEERNKMTTYEADQKRKKATTLMTSEVGGAQPLTERLFMKEPSTMKHRHIPALGLAGCAVLFAGLTVASAQVYVAPAYVSPPYVADSGKDLGFYFNSGLGPSFMPDFQSSRFGFPVNLHMDTGVRLSLAPGYNFLATSRLTLGGEFETGVIYNRVSQVLDANSPISLQGDYYQVPMLANLVLKINPDSSVVPYIGIGGGGDCSFARIDKPGFRGCETHSDRIDPAVQGMCGVSFRLNARTEVSLGYKYLAAFPDEGKYIGTHSVMANFTMKF